MVFGETRPDALRAHRVTKWLISAFGSCAAEGFARFTAIAPVTKCRAFAANLVSMGGDDSGKREFHARK
jgi:hypothetical protein